MGRKTLQQLRGELRRLAPMLERAVGAFVAVQCAIADDEAVGVASLTIRHARKVDGVLHVLKGVLVGISAEKLRMAISHIVTKKRRKLGPRPRMVAGWQWAGASEMSLRVPP